MRSEEELKEFLKSCSNVSGFGLSDGPCPLNINDKKDCLEYCDYPMGSSDRKRCCEEWDKRRGCCAECSFPSAIAWVLGEENNPTDNGQKLLFKALKGDDNTGHGNCPDCGWQRDPEGCNVERDSEACKLNKKPKLKGETHD